MVADDTGILYQQLAYPIVLTNRTGGADLTDEELARLGTYLIATVRLRENQFFQYQNGVLDERTWLAYRAALPAVFSTEFFREWWRNRSSRGEFDAGFVAMVNELFEQHPVGSSRSVREAVGFDPLVVDE